MSDTIELGPEADAYIDVLDRVRVKKTNQLECPVCCGDCDDPLTGEANKCPGCKGEGHVLIANLDKISKDFKDRLRGMISVGDRAKTPGGHALHLKFVAGGDYTRKDSARLLIDPSEKKGD